MITVEERNNRIKIHLQKRFDNKDNKTLDLAK